MSASQSSASLEVTDLQSVWLNAQYWVSLSHPVFAQSFLFVSAVVSSLVSVLALVLFRALGSDINRIPAGPTAILLGTVYQFSRIVPASYRFRIGPFNLSNKAFHFLLAIQVQSC